MSQEKTDSQFKITNRFDGSKSGELYSDSFDISNRYDREKGYESTDEASLDEVLETLSNADTNKEPAVLLSEKLFATNLIYQQYIENLANSFLWRYVVVPHPIKNGKKVTADKYSKIYFDMVNLVEGLNLEVKMPQILKNLLIDGAAYVTSYFDKETETLNLITLPWKFCRKIGETPFGTKVIMFNYAYFDSLGLTADQIKEVLKCFPDEMAKGYRAYKNDAKKKWQVLDASRTSAIMLNPKGIPTTLYIYGGIINYRIFTNNEINKSGNQVENIIVHKIPTYQDKLLLEVPEMQDLHSRIAKIVKTATHTRLITTIGDISVHPLQEQETRENEVLTNAYKSIYELAGLNGELFAGSNAEALKEQERVLRSIVWGKVEEIINFINIQLNNGTDLNNGYQADLAMLSISRDSIQEDIARYQAAASVGVGITNFIVASGVKQKNIESYLDMEENLGYRARLKPLLSTYTATATNSGDSSSDTQSQKDDTEDDTGTGNNANSDEQTQDDSGDNGVTSDKSKGSTEDEQK